jgi:rhomboid protease GluP
MLERRSSGSMICPDCGKLISITEERCPFCGAWRPGLYGWTPAIQRWFGNRANLVAMISVACIVLYVISLLLQPEAIFQNFGLFSLLSPGMRALYQLGMTGGVAWQQGWWWTVFTAIYLHGGVLHIFFNVMCIRNLGPGVVDVYGPARSFVIFTAAGVVGFLVSNFASGGPVVGASGSVYGLLAALIVYGRRVGHSVLTAQLWQWALIMFVMGFFLPSVNNWAHAGGFAGGWGAATLMQFHHERRESRGVQLLALACVLATVVGFGLSFYTVTRMLVSG